MIKIILLLLISFLNVIGKDIVWGTFSLKIKFSKYDGFLSESDVSNTLDRDNKPIKLYKKDLSSG